MKIVIDTNIIINAWKDDFSYERKIIDEVMQGNIQAFVSHKIWREYQLILDRLVNDQEHYDLCMNFFNAVKMIETGREVRVVKYDRDDNKFFTCAIAAKSRHIISDDMHLHEVGEYRGIKAYKAKTFWLEYKKQGDPDGKGEWQSWMKGIIGG